MSKYVLQIFILICLSCSTSRLRAEANGLDFDGDKFSEMVGYEVQSDGSPNEIAMSWLESSTGNIIRKEFGKNSESFVPADYDGDGITDLSVIGPDSSNKLQWRFKLSSNDENESSGSQFGVLGDKILSGCDFDGDLKADRVAITKEGYFVMEQSSNLQSFVLGELLSSFERFTCGDLTGDGVVDLIAQKTVTSASKEALFTAWDILNNQKIVDESFGKDVRSIFAADVNGDGVDEYGYERSVSNKSSDLVFNLQGTPFVVRTPRFKGISITNFNGGVAGADGFALKLSGNDKYMRYRSFQVLAAKEELTLSDTSNVVPGVRLVTPGPVQSSESVCNIQQKSNDGAGGFLWKPVSDTTGNVAVLLPSGLRLKNVRIIKAGKIIEKLRYGGNGNGGRDHWRSSRRASSFDSMITITGAAKGANHCWLIEDPNQRVD